MDEYQELMARWNALRDEWMRRIEKARGTTDEFYGMGCVLDGRGGLRMRAINLLGEDTMWEISMERGATRVTETLPDRSQKVL